MRGSGSVGRALAFILGSLLVLSGIASVAVDGAAGAAGAWLIIVGMILMLATVLERWRYRSEPADLSGLPIGPGGGEPLGEPMEGRFQRTDELFVDPTSGRQMRVWLDPQSGERRYRAEG